jgi:hypothetical protein
MPRANDDKVMTAAKVADSYSTTGVVPYTASPITMSPIRQGTFVNNTHVTSTFLCRGCINSSSFQLPNNDTDVFFSYAFSADAVEDPSDINTRLSDHTGTGGEYSVFQVDLDHARTGDYDRYAAMAEVKDGDATPEQPPSVPTSVHTETPTPTITATDTAISTGADDDWRKGCYQSECETPGGSDFSHREMPYGEFFALAMLGVAYLGQVFLD